MINVNIKPNSQKRNCFRNWSRKLCEVQTRSGANKIYVPSIDRLVVCATFDDASLKLRNEFATTLRDKRGADLGN